MEEDQGVSVIGTGLTLKKLSVWLSDPLVKLKAIASLVDVCQGECTKGWCVFEKGEINEKW